MYKMHYKMILGTFCVMCVITFRLLSVVQRNGNEFSTTCPDVSCHSDKAVYGSNYEAFCSYGFTQTTFEQDDSVRIVRVYVLTWTVVHTDENQHQHAVSYSKNHHPQPFPLSYRKTGVSVRSMHRTSEVAPYYDPTSHLPYAAVVPQASYQKPIEYSAEDYGEYGYGIRQMHPTVLGGHQRSELTDFIERLLNFDNEHATAFDVDFGVYDTRDLYDGHQAEVQVKVTHRGQDHQNYADVNILSGDSIDSINLRSVLAHLGLGSLDSIHQIRAIADHIYAQPQKVIIEDHHGPPEKLHGHIQSFYSVETIDHGGEIISSGKSNKNNAVLDGDFADLIGYANFNFAAD
ncbi:uncharacterized protein LOC111267150 isoform X2 [Varroa jacobsoni]|uniref:uncharacterized protein LOC111267150 isoform X2 n=1 Tax=Varroa jacobsoni TaxID=62625 RepID=UPI000BF7F3A3|nr:uncharacterized protein LOC111267150 isoform X2 [Varroa jacobsoni]